jgi:carbamoyltransferase
MSVILGINAYHADSSACILRDGELLAAVEEERFNRIKHWAGLPVDAVRYCLREAGVTFDGVSVIAVNSDPAANIGRRLRYVLTRRPGWRMLRDRLLSRRMRQRIPDALASILGVREFSGTTYQVEHHLAHLASAFLVSPFDESTVVSIDAFGDFTSTAWGLGHANSITVDGKIHFPHSLGIFYETITHFLGFKHYGDEYKIMGLAPYGQARHMGEMAKLVRLRADGEFELDLTYFRHHRGETSFKWDGCEPVADDYFNEAFIELLGRPRDPEDPLTQRDMDIAHSAQAMYENALFHLLRHTHEIHDTDALVLSGGCAFNSVANGKVRDRTPYENVYVQAAAGDAGGALGAALYVNHIAQDAPRLFCMDHAYWGPESSEEEIVAAIARRRSTLSESACNIERLDCESLYKATAAALAEGMVVGWFQGRSEWGPRALGNRSILGDPRRPDMKDILNAKIKRRESFRPFAPTILRERVSEWFEADDDVPFMMKVLPVRKERRREIPAVTHVDGSARLQTVTEDQNQRFYRLIEAFESITGVPILLNTSFNENEPIVNSVDEALDCFLRTGMDILVVGEHIVRRGVEAKRQPATRSEHKSEWPIGVQE